MKPGRDQGIYCPDCDGRVDREKLYHDWKMCPFCQYHFPLTADERLALTLDRDSFRPIAEGLLTEDCLQFPEYLDKIEQDRRKTNLQEAVLAGVGNIGGHEVVMAAMDTRFRMGSMGSVVGETIVRAIRYAHDTRLPLIVFSASGGARMQEGIFSLMQMGRTAMELGKFHRAGGLYISVLTHPTTGGVTASFAALGDIIIAEPRALIGFAGPRVIQQTIRQQLPEGFQRAEFLQDKGFLDLIVSRPALRETLLKLLNFHKGVRAIG
ncbi:acetyl-CoA carboxylase, carboxyltransferase subunit beta [Brevibacillus fulvus]|uniref:Acetyl-coenzyme A carboxylase carboxyl transferase subunit beta n=1 Tax=Brevibacillus fulvus TaxID=1125967 RepID=A0A939BRF4_9BACL|nr:acetyl-CoA carboxylase, carboxyltransferase subunit beta [Brevibacillus fulvus]MBM7589562.1 acetyl-CoA carboxylase carboxyl transferase subunit beta [Brevibacillus fulvus]